MQKKRQVGVILPILYFFSSPLLAYSDPTHPLHVAVGEYQNANKTSYPFIGVSKDEGKTWTYPAIPRPADYGNFSQLYGTDCNSFYCVGVGFYANTNKDTPPFLTVSTDQGAHWSFVATQPKDATFTSYDAVSCNKETCVIAGSYELNDTDYFPLIAVGNNKGDEWTFPILPASKEAEFFNINCTEKYCIAVGDQNNQQAPLLAVSSDQGMHWKYINVPLPSDYAKDGRLLSVSCNKIVCLAGGIYTNQAGNIASLLLVSTNPDESWTKVTIPPSPIKVDESAISQIHCNDTSCIAVGNYGLSPTPLLLLSTDNGTTWSYPPSIISPLPKDVYVSEFDDVNCNGTQCIAVGEYLIDGKDLLMIPWLAISHDAGATWTYKTPLPTDFAGTGENSRVSCDEHACIIVGQYFNGKHVLPLINITNDQGATWSFQFDITAIPKDFDFTSGCFFTMGSDTPSDSLHQKKQFGIKAIADKFFVKSALKKSV